MTLTDAQIRELLGLTFTPADASLIVASRARLRALCEEVLRLRAENDRLRLLHKIADRDHVFMELAPASHCMHCGVSYKEAFGQCPAVPPATDNGDGDPA